MRRLELAQVSYTYPASRKSRWLTWRYKTDSLNEGERPSKPVLDRIDLSLQAGEKLALIGPSGCGKSTLLAVLAGLIAPDSGSLKADGEAVESFSSEVALMPQRDGLYDWLTVAENVSLAAKIQGKSKAERKQIAARALAEFGMSELATAWPAELSGGMRSRIAFLRTMLSGRPIVALDEPFGALDALTREELQQWLIQVVEDKQLTLVMVTHDVDEAVLLADRVLVMGKNSGQISAQIDSHTVSLESKNTVSAQNQHFVQLRAQVMTALEETKKSQNS